MALNVADPACRADGVTKVYTRPGAAARIRTWSETKAGVTLGNSLGFAVAEAEEHLRIGHMGHQNVDMIMGTLGAIETGIIFQPFGLFNIFYGQAV